MKKLLINCNDCFALYTFRLELLKELKTKYDLYITASEDSYYMLLRNEGFEIILSNIQSNKKSLLKDIKLLMFYKKLIKKIDPDLIINYTVKPHIYASI